MDTTVKNAAPSSVVYKELPVQVLSSDDTARTIDFIFSDESLDRDEDIILADGWDFSEFAKNPQFLGFHNKTDFPLGKPIAWGVDSRQKRAWIRVHFPRVEELATNPEHASEKAKLVDTTYHMYRLKMLNAVSAGFAVMDMEPHKSAPGNKRLRGNVLKRCKLYEVSAVPIPANPNALSLVKSMKAESFAESIFTDYAKNPAEMGINTKGLEIVHNLISPEESNMDIKALEAEIVELKAQVAELKADKTSHVVVGVSPELANAVEKAGRKLSKASMDKLKACGGKIKEAAEIIEAMVSDGVLVDDDGTSDGVEKPKADAAPVTKGIDLAAMTVEEVDEIIRNSAESH